MGKNYETIIYLCRYCLGNKRQEISPRDRQWVCDCGVKYVIVPGKKAGEKKIRLQESGRSVVTSGNNFSLWSKNKKKLPVGDKIMLAVPPDKGR
jgi:hypothetical protein